MRDESLHQKKVAEVNYPNAGSLRNKERRTRALSIRFSHAPRATPEFIQLLAKEFMSWPKQ